MSAAPVLLSLDTATDRVHIALTVGEALFARALPGGAQASATLLPALAALLAEAGLAWPDVDAIAFGSGPGAFTGLRTACSVAQGLALALAVPVIPLDTLMAVAEDARQAAPAAFAPGDILWVLQDARMEELYASAFQWDGRRWHVAEPARLWPLEAPLDQWHVDRVAGRAVDGSETASVAQASAQVQSGIKPTGAVPRWAGNAAAAYAQRGAEVISAMQPGYIADPAATPGAAEPAAPRGPALAALAREAWSRGATVDAALALPRYVRDKVAQTTAERAADKSARAGATPGPV